MPPPTPDLLDLLDHPPDDLASYTQEELHSTARTIEATLADHNCDGRMRVVEIHPGPAITRYEVELCPPRALPRYVADLESDLVEALDIAQVQIVFRSDVSTMSVEVPNHERRAIRLRDVLVDPLDDLDKMRLPFALGLDAAGAPVITDLAKLPHLLIAGAGATGKTAVLQAMVTALLLARTPEQVRLVLADPSGYSFGACKGIPHLLRPVARDADDGVLALGWALEEMMRRLHALRAARAKSIDAYNRSVEGLFNRAPMPRIVVIIDELADLMTLDKETVEDRLVRIAGMGRLAGIHLVVATKHISVNVITGLVKANVPGKMAYRVVSQVDSRIVLDEGGAEQLLRQGDALFRSPGGEIQRVHTPVATDAEIERICEAHCTPGERP